MIQKFWFLTSESFRKKIKSKWFLVANLILLLAMIAIFNIDQIITFFGGDFDSTKEVIVIDQTGENAYSQLENIFMSLKDTMTTSNETVLKQSFEDVEKNKEELKDTDKILIVLTPSSDEYIKASIITESYLDTVYYQYLYQALTQLKTSISLENSAISAEEYQNITAPISIDRVILNEEESSDEEIMNMMMGTVFPTLILPFVILVIFLVQMIGLEINEEKSSRSMEIIISNVSPKTHFFSKVVSCNAFIFMQALLLFLYGVIALLVRRLTGNPGLSGQIGQIVGQVTNTLSATGVLNKLSLIIPLTILLVILSFIGYSLIAGILASMTVSVEDFQQVQSPIMFVCMISYYLAIMSSLFHGSIFLRILSYVPFLSSLLAPALLITNQIQVIDVLISIAILIVFNWALVRFGLKVYKIGILNYTTDKMWRKLLKAVKEKE